jgi:hypothetical protein
MASPRSDLDELQSRLRAVEERLRMAEIAGGIATFEHDFSTGAWTLSARFWNLLDREGSDPPTFEEVARSVFPDDLLKLQAAAEAARTAGTLHAEFRLRLSEGVRWLEARGRTVAIDGKPRLWGAFYDISQRKALEARLLSLNETLEGRIAELGEETRALGVLNRASTAISANLELESVVQAVTDAAVELSGAAFGAFFYNLVSEKGESYTFYTLSGAPRAAFEKFPMPRNTAIFEPTFRGLRSCARPTSWPIRATARASPISACPRAICRCAPIWRCRWRRTAARCWAGSSSGILSPACSPSGPSGW